MDEPRETDAQLTAEIVEMWGEFVATKDYANARGRLDYSGPDGEFSEAFESEIPQ